MLISRKYFDNLCEAIYGGKMDNPFDQRLLDTFLVKLFNPETFEPNFILAEPEGGGAIKVPDGTKSNSFKGIIGRYPL